MRSPGGWHIFGSMDETWINFRVVGSNLTKKTKRGDQGVFFILLLLFLEKISRGKLPEKHKLCA
jgi:hypothetical protein